MKLRTITTASLSAFFLTLAMSQTTQASTLSDLQDKETSVTSKIETLSEKQNELSSQINTLVPQIEETTDKQAHLSDEIDQKKAEIKSTKKDLKAAIKKKDDQYEAMKLRLKVIYKNQNRNPMYAAVENFTDYLNQTTYTNAIASKDDEILKNYEETVQEEKDLRDKLNNEKKELDITKQGYDKQLQELNEQKQSLEDKKSTVIAKQNKLEKRLEKIQKKIQEEKARLAELASKMGGGNIENIKHIAQRLRAAGYPDSGVAAILGNMFQENGSFEPTVGNRDAGYGLCQWTGSSFDVFQAYVNSIGGDIASVDSQIDVLLHELQNLSAFYPSYAGAYLAAGNGIVASAPPARIQDILMSDAYTVEQKTWYFCLMFERPYYENSKVAETRVPHAEGYLAGIEALMQ